MADSELAEFQEHLEALWAMPLDAAQELKQKLYEKRRLIDGQLLVVDQVIARHKTDASAPVVPWPEPVFPRSGPPSSGVRPSRRMALLNIMANDPQRDWHLQELKPLMVAAGVVDDDAVGTDRVSAAASECKAKQEAEHVGPSLYRITKKGLAAVGR